MSFRYPDRWLDYTPYGSQVQDTQFIALKVPLAQKYFNKHSEERFTPNDVIEKNPRIGLIIDLTYTSKYYHPLEFLQHDVQHKKIFTKGHSIPNRRLVDQFIETVNIFLKQEQNKDKLIGVHCTHGLNRTGYFICAYMILVLGHNPKSAIDLFNEARTHSIERVNYLDSLLCLRPLDYKNKKRNSLNGLDHKDRPNNWRNHFMLDERGPFNREFNQRRYRKYSSREARRGYAEEQWNSFSTGDRRRNPYSRTRNE